MGGTHLFRRLSDQEGVSVIGPTLQDDEFERFEITPIKEKDWVGSLFKFYIDDNKVAVYQYSNGGYLTKDTPPRVRRALPKSSRPR